MSRLSDATLVDKILDDTEQSKLSRQAYLNELVQRIKNRTDDGAATRYWILIEHGRSAEEAVKIIKVYDQLLAGKPLSEVVVS